MAALDEAIYELTGAGLIVSAEALGVAVPAGAARHGDAFIGYLAQRGDWVSVARLATLLKHDMASEAAARGWGEREAAHICRLLAGLLDGSALDAARLAAAAGSPTAEARNSAAAAVAEAAGERLAARDAFAAGTLDRAAVTRVLEQLIGRLTEMWAFVASLEPAYRQFFSEVYPSAAPPGAAAPAPDEPADEPIDESAVAALTELGIAPARARDLVAAADDARVRALIDQGVKPAALARLAALLDGRNVPTPEFAAKLGDSAQRIARLRATLVKPGNERADTRRRKSEAAAALADGDLEHASALLKQTRRTLRDERRRLEERLREDLANLDMQMAAEAAVTAELAEMRFVAREFPAAADLFQEAQDSLPRTDRSAAWRYLMRQADSLLGHGEDTGEADALAEAVRLYRAAAKLAAGTAAHGDRAAAQLALARALHVAGERRGDSGLIGEAVGAYRAALEAFGKDGDPAERARCERLLGQALTMLGEREGVLAHHRAAAEAYRRAIALAGKADGAERWGDAHLGLGLALLALDEREPDPARLAQAIAALREALAAFDPRLYRRPWSTAQLNLGNALLSASERGGGPDLLEEAIAALRSAAHSGFSRTHEPERWASARMSLANALAARADRGGADDDLDAAASFYRHAIARFDRSSAGILCAIAEMNLGTVLVRLGERRPGDDTPYGEAEAVIASALAAFEAAGEPGYADLARKNLASLKRALARPRARRA